MSLETYNFINHPQTSKNRTADGLTNDLSNCNYILCLTYSQHSPKHTRKHIALLHIVRALTVVLPQQLIH